MLKTIGKSSSYNKEKGKTNFGVFVQYKDIMSYF